MSVTSNKLIKSANKQEQRFSRDTLRTALGQFPTGVCVVTANSNDGEDLGMTISSFNSLSLEPPLILFSIDRRANSLPAWREADGYAINILAENQKAISGRFARPLTNKWEGISFDRGYANAPILRGTVATLECAKYELYPGGDHELFVARVVSVRTAIERSPLIFCKSNYGALRAGDEQAPLWPLAIHY